MEDASPQIGPLILGETAKQLLLTDEPEPLLLRMTAENADGKFMYVTEYKHQVRASVSLICQQKCVFMPGLLSCCLAVQFSTAPF